MIRSLVLLLLLASNSWATSDSLGIIASDQNTLAELYDSTSKPKVKDSSVIPSQAFPLVIKLPYLNLDTQNFSLHQQTKYSLYLTRAPPLSARN